MIDARKAKGVSQEALADALGVSRQAVSKWETGESKPDVGNLIALCDTLDLNIDYLCFGKASSSEQIPVRKAVPLWVKIILFSVAMVLSIIVGALLSALIGGACTAVESDAGKEVLTQRIDIVDLTVVSARAAYNLDAHQYEVFVTPNVVNKDLQMMLRVENADFPTEMPITAQCTLDDGVYKWIFDNPMWGTDYRIIAVFKLGETYKQVPVMNVQMGDGSCLFEPLWGNAD